MVARRREKKKVNNNHRYYDFYYFDWYEIITIKLLLISLIVTLGARDYLSQHMKKDEQLFQNDYHRRRRVLRSGSGSNSIINHNKEEDPHEEYGNDFHSLQDNFNSNFNHYIETAHNLADKIAPATTTTTTTLTSNAKAISSSRLILTPQSSLLKLHAAYAQIEMSGFEYI